MAGANLFRGNTLALGLVVTGVVVVSIALLHPNLHGSLKFLPIMGCTQSITSNQAYRADLSLLSRLDQGPSLVKLTDGGESALELLNKMDSYNALVIVTAGQSTLARRAEDQPFISIAHRESGDLRQQQHKQVQKEKQEAEAVVGTSEGGNRSTSEPEEGARDGNVEEPELGGGQLAGQQRRLLAEEAQPAGGGAAAAADPMYDSGLAALARAVGLMNTAASGVERVLGRRLFPITISTFDRTAGGTVTSGPYAIFDASAGALLLDRKLVSYTWGADMPQVSYIAGQLASRVFSQMSDMLRLPYESKYEYEGAASYDSNDDKATAATSYSGAGHGAEFRIPGGGSGDGGGGGAAATAARIAAAALAVALPAAFAAAPPLWFCILCPSVLGLLAPLLINLALNQIAGLLCSQLHLDDQTCFDVLLGALGAGFVLSLASAVPIFFVCRLPECAGKNVTAALRRVLPPLR